jgi:leucyl-tRNA synthetase
MQENWIGKSEGVRFAFPHDIRDADGTLIGDGTHVRVHHARRHHHGRDLLRGGRRTSAGRARGAAATRRSPPSSTSARHGGTTEAELATTEKKGMPTGLFVTHPLTGAAGRRSGSATTC